MSFKTMTDEELVQIKVLKNRKVYNLCLVKIAEAIQEYPLNFRRIQVFRNFGSFVFAKIRNDGFVDNKIFFLSLNRAAKSQINNPQQ